MCTLSWLRGTAGYTVFMNRDERPTRAPGLAPKVRNTDGTAWLAPEDGDHAGTWIGVNESGLTLALLNRWHESPVAASGPWTSRGLLVASLLSSRSPDDLALRLGQLRLADYQPFTLAQFAAGRDAALFSWSGQELTSWAVTASGLVLASSGHDQEGATGVRQRLLAEAMATAEAYEALHRSHLPARGPLSICMHRPEAATVSYTRVEVAPAGIEMVYVPGPPCITEDRMVVRLPTRDPGRE